MSEMWRCPEHWDTDIPGSFNNDLCPICVINRLKDYITRLKARIAELEEEALHHTDMFMAEVAVKDRYRMLLVQVYNSSADDADLRREIYEAMKTDRAQNYRDTLDRIMRSE